MAVSEQPRRTTRLSTSLSAVRLLQLRQDRDDGQDKSSDGKPTYDVNTNVPRKRRRTASSPPVSIADTTSEPNGQSKRSQTRCSDVHDGHLQTATQMAQSTPSKRTGSATKRTKDMTQTPSHPDMDDDMSSVTSEAAQPRTSGRKRRPPQKFIADTEKTAVRRESTTEDQGAYKVIETPARSTSRTRASIGTQDRKSSVKRSKTRPSKLATEADNTVDRNARSRSKPTLADLQMRLMHMLLRKTPSALYGLEQQYNQLSQLVEQTVGHGESNSLVLVGARGCGKKALVDEAIASARRTHGDDFYVVRLNGFIHTDDKVAVREIWTQLHLGRADGVTEPAALNHADTMTTLLALLSHDPTSTDQDSTRLAKGIVLILEEFDLFTTHPRQTLLYNLFDVVQSQKAPLIVLGLTTKLSVAENLEKRVKSRFSHRLLYVPLAKDLAQFREMCKCSLSLDHMNRPTDATDGDNEVYQTWNAMLNSLFTESVAMSRHIASIYYSTKTVADFQTSMLGAVSTLFAALDPTSTAMSSDYDTTAIAKHIEEHIATDAQTFATPDSRLVIIGSLSALQLSLLIAAARLMIIHDTDAVTFLLVYDEYKSLASKARMQSGAIGQGVRLWNQMAAVKAWHGLCETGLVMLSTAHMSTGSGVIGNTSTDLSKVDASLEEIRLLLESGLVEADGVLLKWCKEGL